MTGLMDGDAALLLLGHHLGLLLQTTDDTVDGIEEILFAYFLTVMTGGNQRGLVADIGDIGSREAGRLTGEEVDINRLVNLQWFQMYQEYLLTFVQVWQVYMDLTVETARTEQGRVEHVSTVGGSKDNDTAVGTKTVHLREQGVQRVLTLVVTTHRGVTATRTAHSIDLINEDDARRLCLGLLEEVADTTGTYTYEHLHEVGTRHREERDTGLTGHSFGEQGLTGSRRPHEQGALGNLSA